MAHERFGREWEEKWQQHSDGMMWPYPEEYYLLQRKESYEERKRWKGNLEHWEHDGFGYIVTQQQDTGRGEWSLSRIDMADYCSVGYQFWSKDQMDQHIRREGWRPFEQLALDLGV
jgi:hypothetical protein